MTETSRAPGDQRMSGPEAAALYGDLAFWRDRCRVNRCGRPHGIGTHMTLTGHGRASDETIKVCEEHWQALRSIFPVEVPAKAEEGAL